MIDIASQQQKWIIIHLKQHINKYFIKKNGRKTAVR